MALVWVALGSALGGVGRYLLSGALQRGEAGSFPRGTLAVNLIGSFVIGLVVRYAIEFPDFSPQARLFLTAGFCGGFTTFSTFSYEVLELMEHGHHPRALVYAGASLVLSLAATAAGIGAARTLAPS